MPSVRRAVWRGAAFANGVAAVALAFAAVAAPFACASADQPPRDVPEAALLEAVDALRAGDFTSGLSTLQALVRKQPNFRLAQLLYGEMLAARSGLPDAPSLVASHNPAVQKLLAEYHVRLQDAAHLPPDNAVPSNILYLAPQTRHAVVVDLRRSRLYLLANGGNGVHVLRNYYASIARDGYGKAKSGDLRTPVGVYHVTTYKPGARLPDIYGTGAFPVNYPNAWDRHHGRTGYGIWLHGVPSDTYARPPHATEGCVALANRDLQALAPYLRPGSDTPVVLSDDLHWEPRAAAATLVTTLRADIQGWRTRWSARDTSGYLAYYASDFRSDDGMGRAAFAAYKRRVNAAKRYIHIGVRDLDLFRYPGTRDLVMATFTQVYKSDNYRDTSRKQQFWHRQPDGSWKIVFEAGG